MVTAPVYPLFDLKSEEPWERRSRRQAAKMGGPIGPVGARTIDARAILIYEVVINRASELEMKRLRDLWTQTRFGVLPMRYVHPDDGEVFVAFDDPDLVWSQINSDLASVTVRLAQVLGA